MVMNKRGVVGEAAVIVARLTGERPSWAGLDSDTFHDRWRSSIRAKTDGCLAWTVCTTCPFPTCVGEKGAGDWATREQNQRDRRTIERLIVSEGLRPELAANHPDWPWPERHLRSQCRKLFGVSPSCLWYLGRIAAKAMTPEEAFWTIGKNGRARDELLSALAAVDGCSPTGRTRATSTASTAAMPVSTPPSSLRRPSASRKTTTASPERSRATPTPAATSAAPVSVAG